MWPSFCFFRRLVADAVMFLQSQGALAPGYCGSAQFCNELGLPCPHSCRSKVQIVG